MTKVLASTVAMMLVEAKALDLEAPVADYIPSFKVRIHTIHYPFIWTGLFAGEGKVCHPVTLSGVKQTTTTTTTTVNQPNG